MNTERPDHDGAGAAAGRAQGDEERAGRRRPRGVLTASVAAAVLLVGGGGAYLAATAAGGSGGSGGGASPEASGTSAPPPLALDALPADGGSYRADGSLPDGPGSAPVYRSTGQVSAGEVARLARALGLADKPVVRGKEWTVGTVKDGSGPVLRVTRQAPGNWSFQRSPAGSDDCAKVRDCPAPPATGDPVGAAAAKKAAAPVLDAVGQGGAALDAGQVMGARRVVNADPVVGGVPTSGWTTGVVVGADGTVTGGSGRLKAPVKGDVYPVLDAGRTVEEMNDGGAGAGVGGCASAVPLEGGVSCEPRSGRREAAATVERAVFGLAAHPVRGRETLVPSWLFAVRTPGAAGTVTVTHPAVDPAYLTSAAPSEEPTAAPTGRDVDVTGYTAESTELTVRFTGGVCADYAAEADEESGKVTVTVTETSDPEKVCILIAEEYERTVRLKEPLGSRSVVGSDGEEIPLAKKGARLPDPDPTGPE
ncbi:hypothetical protein [Streptomyces sp. CRN 30]|uniref:hypothetical protein n=1 Tax=Streptomyces sp. CRN 30 TaxID=3075613 RepID=UPI002A7FBCED|nr:hypothetical protein [Streptomyces sp. CRN 30]